MKNKLNFKSIYLDIIFYAITFLAISIFAILQTFGDGPDEINRFKIVFYICKYGKLPIGFEPEVLIAGFGASYAYQPILTYIIQGFLLRFLTLFTADSYVLLLAARMVNVCFGVSMAVFVRKISKEVFVDSKIQWLFTLMIVFLPQNIFIHSYVNTDSMALLSVAMMFYGLVLGLKYGWKLASCLYLAFGIILCAMSYYNAYGMILASILVFVYSFIQKKNAKLSFDWKPMLKAGVFISAVVLLGIGWWFVRNYIHYDGDLLGMNARLECAIQTATEEYNPLTRWTYQNASIPIWKMVLSPSYFLRVAGSFIGVFGPMLLTLPMVLYFAYFLLIGFGLLRFCLPQKSESKGYLTTLSKDKINFFHLALFLEIIITIGLAVYYSYSWEFQPQGRYMLPILVPLMYFVTVGLQKANLKAIWVKIIFVFFIALLLYSIFVVVVPHYAGGTNMFDLLHTSYFETIEALR